MDLKSTINNTNTQKENIKTVATNIDNKLIELGGEKAENLNDVVNKMGAMVGQYKKIAMGEYRRVGLDKNAQVDININLDFNPKQIFIMMQQTIVAKGFADSKKHFSKESSLEDSFYIPSFSKNLIKIVSNFYAHLGGDIIFYWIAIG